MKRLFARIADILYRDRSNAWKAAFSTLMISFVAVLAGAFLTLFSSLQEWVGDGDTSALIADVKASGKLMLSAFIAIWIGIVNYVFRWAQAKIPGIPGEGPTYGQLPPPPPPPPPAVPEFA